MLEILASVSSPNRCLDSLFAWKCCYSHPENTGGISANKTVLSSFSQYHIINFQWMFCLCRLEREAVSKTLCNTWFYFSSSTHAPEKAAKTGISLESWCSSLHPYHHLAEAATSICTDLAWADRASVILQHPNLTIVLDFAFMDTVSCAVLAMGTSTVIPSIQVKANSVIGTAMPSSPTFINVCKNMPWNALKPHSINKNALVAVNINDS